MSLPAEAHFCRTFHIFSGFFEGKCIFPDMEFPVINTFEKDSKPLGQKDEKEKVLLLNSLSVWNTPMQQLQGSQKRKLYQTKFV